MTTSLISRASQSGIRLTDREILSLMAYAVRLLTRIEMATQKSIARAEALLAGQRHIAD